MADYSIYPIIRKDKPIKRNNKYPIYLRVRIYDREAKLPTSLDVAPDEWNAKKKEPKEKTLRLALSSKILSIETFLNTCIATNIPLSIDKVKTHLLTLNPRVQRANKVTFYGYFDKLIERIKPTITKGTLRAYTSTYHVLKEYREEIDISEINLSFIEDFDKYLREIRKNTDGGCANRHKVLRTIILDMIKHDLPVKNPYNLFKMPKCKIKETYLEKSELEQFSKLYDKLPQNGTLFKCLEMYLFACFCGLRFSDVITLQWGNIDFENGLIIKKQVKTHSEVKAPLFDRARKILERVLRNNPQIKDTDRIFSDKGCTDINVKLKELASLAGIEKPITFHSSRHTFATLLVLDGVSIYKIQNFLGHKSVNMTERYLKFDLKIAQNNKAEIDTFN